MSNKGIAGLLVIGIVLSLPVAFFLNLYAMTHLWLWFIVPLGVPAIGMAHAWGILILKEFLRFKFKKVEDSPKGETEDERNTRLIKDLSGRLATMYIAPIVSIVAGYVATLFM